MISNPRSPVGDSHPSDGELGPMSLSDPSSSDGLDSVLLQVMSTTGPEAMQRIEQLQQTYPQFASEITECWELHKGFRETAGHVPSRSTVSPRFGSRIGARLGTYELLDELDRGGMGIVYRARHPLLDRTVALKVIRSGELADAVEVHRFQTEARAAARLSHPGIIAIYEVGQEGDLVYYTMPLVEGQTLSLLMNALRIEPRESARIVHQLALAMEHAHSRGVTHRDLKPSNVLLHADMQPIIIDFGLAKIAQSAADLTGDGIVGTPAYIAPEQLRGGSLDLPYACDVYALGGILYFLLSGRPPFVGPSAFDILLQVKDREPMAPSHWNRNVGSELNAICARAMEKDPRNRYPSAAALAVSIAGNRSSLASRLARAASPRAGGCQSMSTTGTPAACRSRAKLSSPTLTTRKGTLSSESTVIGGVLFGGGGVKPAAHRFATEPENAS
jgi:serine/threonine protein kinase